MAIKSDAVLYVEKLVSMRNAFLLQNTHEENCHDRATRLE